MSATAADRAVQVLRTLGPQSPDQLARWLGLQGPAPLTRRVMSELLANDPRLVVDDDGRWSVRPLPAWPVRPWCEERWAVVDVETTGTSPARGHRVTEIAVVQVDGDRIVDVFHTLVYPERSIPPTIAALTGITDAMVAAAPRFREVAPRVAALLQERIFVAHNAAFDWRFVAAEFSRAGLALPAVPRLCTVQLARRLLRAEARCSLDALAFHFGIEIEARHRAAGDAHATARVLLRLVQRLEEDGIAHWQSLEMFLRHRPAPSRRRRVGPMDRVDPYGP